MQDDIDNEAFESFKHWLESFTRKPTIKQSYIAGYRAHAARSGWVDIEDASERIYLTSVIGYLAGFAPTILWQNPKNRSEWGKYDDNKNFIPALQQPSHILNLKPYPQLKGGE